MAHRARRRLAGTAFLMAMLGTAPAALAGPEYVGRTPPTVPNDPGTPQVLGQVETRGATGASGATGATDPIPITGGDVAGLTAIGLAAVATGTVLLRRGRRAPG